MSNFGNAGGVLAPAGAAAASVPMWGGVPASTWISAGSSVLSAAMAPSPSPATSSANQRVEQTFDFGNWTVATGGSKAEGGTSGLDLSALLQSPLLILGLAAMGFVAWKHRKPT